MLLLNKKNPNGFTVIEIIAVLIIMAVIVVVTVTRYTSQTYYDVTAETAILKANLRYAQFRAISDADITYGGRNSTWGVALSGSSYTLQHNGNTATINFPEESSPTHTLPSGISVTSSTLTYDISGMPVDSSLAPVGNISITITDGTSSQTITVLQKTGFIQ